METSLLKCRDVTEQATALLEGGMSLRGRLALRLHLAFCSMCRAYLDQLRKTRTLLQSRTLQPLDRAAEDALLARITQPKGDATP